MRAATARAAARAITEDRLPCGGVAGARPSCLRSAGAAFAPDPARATIAAEPGLPAADVEDERALERRKARIDDEIDRSSRATIATVAAETARSTRAASTTDIADP